MQHVILWIFAWLVACLITTDVIAQSAVSVRPRVGIVTDMTDSVHSKSIEALIAVLRRNSFDVVELKSDQIPVDNTRQGLAALILPDSTNAQTKVLGPLQSFAANGGHLVLLGPKPFSSAFAKNDKSFTAETEFDDLYCEAKTYESRQVRRIVSSAQSITHRLPSLATKLAVDVSPVFTLPRDGYSVTIPLLFGQSDDATESVVAAAVLSHYAGEFVHSRWLLCGIGLDDVTSHPDLLNWLVTAVRATINGDQFVSNRRTDLAGALGVTVAKAGYSFTKDGEIAEGSRRLHELGTTSIKLWFTQLPSAYPKTRWDSPKTLKEVAESAPFDGVFRESFTTYFLEAFSVGLPQPYWRTDPTPERLKQDEQEFYDLSVYLLKTFAGSGKTFVLQNWEGDWAVRPKEDATIEVPESDFERMADWLNARQRGVDRARTDIGEHGVRVLCAAEVNHVRTSITEGRRNVIDAVIPKTNIDLVSYSCYDSQTNPRMFRACLEHIASQLKPKAGIEGCRVYVGEYGMPETTAGLDKVQKTIPDVVDISLAFGCPYVVYWQLYCNEAIHKPVSRNEDTRGLWLIKPDGSKAWAWDYLQKRIAGHVVDMESKK